MFIETELTPNPETLKFLPGKTLLDQGSVDFPEPESAEKSPLARGLFGITGVRGVFIGYDFVTVTKDPDLDWQDLKSDILAALMQFFMTGAPVVEEGAIVDTIEEATGEDAEIVNQIRELLDQKIRPAVAQDGGDIVYHGFKEGIVYLRMQGSCAGCPSASMTLKSGIENLLKYYVPEVVEVRQVS